MTKRAKIGRREVLDWLNELIETDYPKIEHLADGVAYAQIIDAIHPKTIPLFKLNCIPHIVHPRSPEEKFKNLKLVDEILLKIKVRKTIDPEKLCKGIFTDHMELIQWLFSYFHSQKGNVRDKYQGYTKRVEAYKRQKHIPLDRPVAPQMAPHLLPNDLTYDSDVEESSEMDLNQQRLIQLRDLVMSLEQELTSQVSNYKLLQEDIGQVEEERNFYFNKLRKIELMCQDVDNELSMQIIGVLSETPEEFQKAQG